MVRYTGPRNRIARRFGANIFGRARNPLLHKANPPGVHGAKKKKKSEYGAQLDEQQKLRACYGLLTRKQLIQYYQKAVCSKEQTPEAFMAALESRLDTVVYRLKLSSTIFGAQQLVAHGHIEVNGKKVNIRSFQVKPGMRISIREKSRNINSIKTSLENTAREIPGYLSLNAADFSGEILAVPQMDQIPLPVPVNIPLVCEFLAHTS